jgi:glycosyltransferase involved in cell wall biosynthesis
MRVVHLMASPFFGGPERQMLGLARHLPQDVRSTYLSFAENGLALPFIDEVRRQGFEGIVLRGNFPHVAASVREVAREVKRLRADVLCCSGYKPDVIGWGAARLTGVPVVSVSHGWTAATWKVRRYEALDRKLLRWMDAVVCVSRGQAEKVRRAGVPEAILAVIQNAVGGDAFTTPDAATRAEMAGWFDEPPQWIVGAAGRFSPEKGFAVLVEAAASVTRTHPQAGFVLFGDGPLRTDLEQRIAERGLLGRFVLAGFREDLGRFLPNLDLGVLSSFSEGLPVILLESAAAGVPVVATSVGGIPEVIQDGETGFLVPSGDAGSLASRIRDLLDNGAHRQAMGRAARERVRREFSFSTMGQRYYEVFRRLVF